MMKERVEAVWELLWKEHPKHLKSTFFLFFPLFLFFSCSSLEELTVSFCVSAFSIKNRAMLKICLVNVSILLVLSHASNLDCGQHMHAVTH